ncbi:MAG: DinB family protein [Thermoanaerobaculia bacterium]
MADQVADVTLDALRVRITQVLPAQIRACLDKLSDEEIWSRPNEESNSVGNLVLHLTGSLNHYLNRGLGGIEFNRDRDAEFAERQHIPHAELRERFDDMVRKAEQTFTTITSERLAQPSVEPKMNRLVVEDLINIASHLATHTGQILWITKMFRGGIDDVWIKTHKKLGAWRT